MKSIRFYFCIALLFGLSMAAFGQRSLAGERAQLLLEQLTLEEKVSLMRHSSPAIPRLGIKAYNWWNEALHGVGRFGLATVFPQSIGMAASFNEDLLHRVFTAVSDEARAKSNEAAKQGGLNIYQGLTVWTPNINIFRDPRWGRGQETYGEDPYLTGRLGMAVVRGLQGPENAEYDKMHACAKHFAVHSGPEWNRHSFDAKDIDLRDLWETYLPAFKDLVQKAHVKEVMCAYNRYEGDPCCGSDRLLMQILRDEWGFQGVVVTDCWAVSDFYKDHKTHPDATHASADAVRNGSDLECGDSFGKLVEAVKKGLISEAELDVSLLRLLKARYELGEMEDSNAWPMPYSVVDSKAHQELALQMARESIVLLQNNDNILPLAKNLKIAVMGPNANDSVMQWGNYNGFPSHTVTLLEGIRAKLPEAQIIYEPGCDHTTTQTLQSLFNECRIDKKTGFSATYRNNRKFEGAPVAQTHINTPFAFTTMGATTFAPGVNIRDFSGVYETTFIPSKSGEVVFRVKAKGKIQLIVNGKTVSDKVDVPHITDLYTLKARKGEKYKIELRFAQMYDEDASLNFDLGEVVPVNIRQAVERVKDADIVLFAGGISPSLEGEEMPVNIPGFKGGDRTDIELPEIQRSLVKALTDAGKKVIFINYSGSAVGLEPEARRCAAMLQAWYPGQAGGMAVADVLFGDYNPSGRLPVTFYKNVNQLPDYEDYSMKGRTYRYMNEAPLFPFGHGLSYTTFSYGDARIQRLNPDNNDMLLTIPVTNTGSLDGEEVVQVYLRKPGDSEGPQRTLRAFKRVKIAAGQTLHVSIPLTDESFEWFDTETHTMRPMKDNCELLYGGSSSPNVLKVICVTSK